MHNHDNEMSSKAKSGSIMKDSNIVKIAVQMINEPDKVPQLIEFNQKQPLSGIIQELCNFWGLTNPEQYALQFSENNNRNYITEKNRNEIKNGSVLTLEQSPSKTVEDIIMKINSNNADDKTFALAKLSQLSADITFALEFINKKGLSLIIGNVEGNKFKGIAIAHALSSFVELMEHGVVSWDILEPPFVSKIASFVNNQSVSHDPKIIQASLSILENVVLNGTSKSVQVEKEVTIPNVIMHLQPSSENGSVIQQNTIALINALVIILKQNTYN